MTGGGLLIVLIQAGTLTAVASLAGSAVAWWFKRRDAQQAALKAAEDRDEDELREERQFLDERARKEMARVESERDDARTECRTAHERAERLLRELWDGRAEAIGCWIELRGLRDYILQVHRTPPPAGSPPPPFEMPPDPRRRAIPT